MGEDKSEKISSPTWLNFKLIYLKWQNIFLKFRSVKFIYLVFSKRSLRGDLVTLYHWKGGCSWVEAGLFSQIGDRMTISSCTRGGLDWTWNKNSFIEKVVKQWNRLLRELCTQHPWKGCVCKKCIEVPLRNMV